MASFGNIYTMTQPLLHPRTRPSLAAAAIGGHEVATPEFKFGEANKTPEYLAKYPLGKIPAFEGKDGFLLVESNAITQYLADTAPKAGKREQLLGASPQERARVQQWFWFADQHLSTALTPLTLWRFNSKYGTYDAAKEAESDSSLRRWLEYLEASVKGRKWLADGEGPSIGDLVICGQLYIGFMIYIDAEMRKEFPAIVEYYNRVAQVPEIKDLYNLEGQWVESRKQPDAE